MKECTTRLSKWPQQKCCENKRIRRLLILAIDHCHARSMWTFPKYILDFNPIRPYDKTGALESLITFSSIKLSPHLSTSTGTLNGYPRAVSAWLQSRIWEFLSYILCTVIDTLPASVNVPAAVRDNNKVRRLTIQDLGYSAKLSFIIYSCRGIQLACWKLYTHVMLT